MTFINACFLALGIGGCVWMLVIQMTPERKRSAAQQRQHLLGATLFACSIIGYVGLQVHHDLHVDYRVVSKEITPQRIRFVIEFDEPVGGIATTQARDACFGELRAAGHYRPGSHGSKWIHEEGKKPLYVYTIENPSLYWD